MTTLDRPGENSEQPPAPAPLGQPRPIAFWPSIGWLSVAALAALVFVFALLGSYEFVFGALPSEAKVVEDLMACIYVVIVLVLIEVVRHAGWSASDYFALVIPKRRVLLLAAMAGVAFMLIDNIVGILDPGPPDASAYLDYDNAMTQGFVPLLWLNSIFVAPAAEEMIFRGYLYRSWSQTSLGPSGAIALTALLFGLMHFQYDAFGMISIAISGLILGWLRWRSGSIFPSMLAHLAKNAIVMILVALGGLTQR